MGKNCEAFTASNMSYRKCRRGGNAGALHRFAVCLLAVLALLCITLAASAEGEYLQAEMSFVCDEAYQQVADSLTSDSDARLYIGVYQNGKWYKSVTISAKDGWKADLTDCPLTDSDGNPYEYTFSVPTYKSPCFTESHTLENGVLTVTQTFRPTMDITATFVFWYDDDDYYGRRPKADALTAESFVLTNDTSSSSVTAKVQGSALTVNEDGNFVVTFKDVPTYYYYQRDGKYQRMDFPTIAASMIPKTDYKEGWCRSDISAGTLEVNYTFVSQEIKYQYDIGIYYYDRTWSSSKSSFDCLKGFNVTLPKEITVTLLEDGQPVDRTDATVTTAATSDELPSLDKAWHIPLYNADGTKAELGTFTFEVTPSQENDTLDPHFVQRETETTRSNSLSVTRKAFVPTVYSHLFKLTWDDDDNFMGLREAFTMNLLANGEVDEVCGTQTMPLKDTNSNFNNSWVHIPVRDENGNHVAYSVAVEMDKSYYVCNAGTTSRTSSYNGYNEELSTAITMKLRTQKVTADVEWLTDGSMTETKVRPGSVLLTLYTSADNGGTWQEFFGTPTYAVTGENNWHIEWNAPYCDANGNPLMYKVVQNNLALYDTSYSAQYPDSITEGSETKLTVTNNYVIDWDFDVQLFWDTADPAKKLHDEDETYKHTDITKLATLTINANQDYAAGELTVRMPYQLFTYRDSTDVSVKKPNNCPTVECSLPMAPETSSAYAFNYTIDKHDSDDSADWEIVFTNWKDISSGYNLAATLRYTINPYYTIDCSEGVLTAVGTGKSKTQNEPTTHEAASISYRLDTGIMPRGAKKTVRRLIYSGEGYDFQNYNYVEYTIYSQEILYNQPFRIVLDEQPGENGEIVSVTGGTKFTYNEETGMWESDLLCTSYSRDGSYRSFSTWVVVRYPRAEGADPENEGQMRDDLVYHNTATLHYVAADEHDGDKEENDHLDVYEFPVSAETSWVDYTFHYEGDIYSGSKDMSYFNQSTSAVTSLLYGRDVTGASVLFSMTVNGYNLTEGYRFDFYDDAVYARAEKDGVWTPYVRLTEDDYELVPINYYSIGPKLEVRITLTDIDRTNGDTIDGVVPTEPFTLWGRSGSGEWEKIADITVTEAQGGFIQVDGTLIDGKEYTGLRLTSPDGMQGKVTATVRCYMKLKGSSETLRELAAGNVTEMEIVNISGHDLYTPNENGTYSWANPLSVSSNTDARQTGLDDLDLQDRGAHVYRRSYTTILRPAQLYSGITKTTGTIVYDKINSKADVPFTISAYESFGISTLPDEIYQQWSTDSGVFYDLLPLGYHFDASKGVTVDEYGYNGRAAILESCTVVSDDYLGSGRQLLCFKVKSARAPGENYNRTTWYGDSYSTGFKITFTASITNDDIALYGDGYNVVTYQRGDRREITNGCADDGHGRFDQTIFPVGKDGKYLLKGVNGTDNLDVKNTLFAYCTVNPEPLPTVQTGIRKTVRAHSSTFVRDDISDLGQNYTYRVVIETSKDGYTSDIIMYDVLECAKNGIGWKGEFVSVNCSAAIRRGIDVKVYYSSEDLNYSDEDTLTLYDADGSLNANWQLLTDVTPGKDVKALAVDMRYLTTGEPLVLDTQSVLGFEVTMKAPDELQPVEYAYNQPAYFCKYQGKGSKTVYEKLTVGNVTSVNLRDLQDIVFRKVFDTDDGSKKPLGGARFSLYKCTSTDPEHQHTASLTATNACWGESIATTSSLTDGMVTFSDLDSGVYAVKETSAPSGFSRFYSEYWVFTVDAKNGTISDPVACTSSGKAKLMEYMDGLWTLTDGRYVRDLSVEKTWVDNQNKFNLRPSTLTFDLYRNGELYQTKTVTVSQESDTYYFNALFKSVYTYDEYGSKYNYQIRERVPDGYVEQKGGIIDNAYDTESMTNTCLGVLEIKKIVVGSDTTESFGFTLTLKNADGTAYIPLDKDGNAAAVVAHRYTTDASDYTRETIAPDAQGSIRLTVASGETVQLLGLPYGTIWAVEEDASEYTVVSNPTPAAGTISEDAISTVTFTNTVKPAELTLNVSKEVVGSTADSIPFTFEIAAATQDAPMPASATATVTGVGTVSFAPITYTHTGTYAYCVTEIAGNACGYRYDNTAYEVTVTVTDENGQLKALWTAKTGEAAADKLIFTNTYSATGSLTLTAYKTVNSAAPTDLQVFDFELTSNADTPAVSQTKQNTGNTVIFDSIDYTEADVGKIYNYTVKETSANGNGMTVDTTVYNVHVLVEDNHDGTLKLTATADDGQNAVTRLSFDNTYEATGKLSLTAKKTVNGKEPTKDQCYTFELASGEGTPALSQTKKNKLGVVTFDDVIYTLADAEKTYQYTVRETTQDSEGLTADQTVYTVTVSIADNHDGTMTVTPVYSNGTEAVQEIAFDNKLTGSIVLSKQAEGSEADEEFTFTFTFADEEGTLLTEQFAYTGNKSGVVGNGDVLTLKDGESVMVDGVPVGTICTITEESNIRYTATVNGESASSIRFSVTTGSSSAAFVNTLKTTEFTVTKEWQGGSGGIISLTLYANGKKMNPQPEYARNVDTYTYTGLPKYDANGQPVVYSAKEVYMDGYMTIYKNVSPYESESSFVYTGGTIINRAVTEIAVRKVWTGLDENEETPEITLTLYCNGQEISKKAKPDKNGWYHFYNLPLRDSPYYVVETPVDGYATSYENYGSYADVTDCVYDGGTITNHKLPKTMDNQPLALYGILLLIALAGIVICRKKRQQG